MTVQHRILFDHIPSMIQHLDAGVARLAQESAEEVVDIAKRSMMKPGPSRPFTAPAYRTGELYRSGHAYRRGPFTWEATFDAPYASFLERGTSRMARRPFLEPAANIVGPRYQARCRELLAHLL